MSRPQIRRKRAADEYEIRPFRDADREAYLDLYGTVYSPKSAGWFDWRYSVPYLDHTPIFVAVADDGIVGAEAFLPFRLAAGEEETLALQPADAMVHPDHRRRGLFTRLTEAAIDRYADREPTHFFNFPTPAARPALERLGWRTAGRIPAWYRLVNPRPVLADRVPRATLPVAARAVETAVDGYCRFRRLAGGSPTAEVERLDGVPARTLAALAEGRERIRVRHDEAYYRWRFANPRWESVATYVATADGEPGAAVVTVTHRAMGMRITKVMDAVAPGDDRVGSLAALIEAVVDDAADTDLLAVTESTIPRSVLVGCGFVSDEWPFVSSLCTPTVLVARPIDGAAWEIGGCSVADVDDWRVTFADQDTPF